MKLCIQQMCGLWQNLVWLSMSLAMFFICLVKAGSQIAIFMRPTWGPPGSCRPQMVPMLAPWTLLSGMFTIALHSADRTKAKPVNQTCMNLAAIKLNIRPWNSPGDLWYLSIYQSKQKRKTRWLNPIETYPHYRSFWTTPSDPRKRHRDDLQSINLC